MIGMQNPFLARGLCVCCLFGLNGQMWLIEVVIDEWMFVGVCLKDCFLSL